MVTKQLGPGMFQQFQTQECEQCSNVKYARESETLQVTVEPGMQDKEVSCLSLVLTFHLELQGRMPRQEWQSLSAIP